MKAAIVSSAGQAPVYADFPAPEPAAGEALIRVSAAALSPVVRARAAGTHYSATSQFPFIPGIDGTGRLEDGQRVFFFGPRPPYGSMAEEVAIPTGQVIPLPDELDDAFAAALANPGASSWAAYRLRARLQPGETVLVNGATGTAGRLAVQIARHLGAGKIIATGRNAAALQALEADETVLFCADTPMPEEQLLSIFGAGVDVVLDYLWGRTAEQLLIAGARAGVEGVPIRFVQIGSIGGADITLPSAVLRSSSITLMGSGLGGVSLDQLTLCLREMLQAAAPARLAIATRTMPLSALDQAWSAPDEGKRLVFTLPG
ncbi:MAG: alcohol dehydrogenase [Pelagibacterium sp. SCN 64-44]|nr:MAG: alcohol dehydrogenase [Pelagibacterium sp. SCN 64-44]